jgi:Zn-dependent membrane protease YugP
MLFNTHSHQNNFNKEAKNMDYYILSLLFIPVLLFTIYANIHVNSTYRKYQKHTSVRGITGAQAAQYVLRANNIADVDICCIPGTMTDHYDPRNNTINLSKDVYHGSSISAIGIACHEAGHAMQHANGYLPVKIRAALVPITNIGAKCSGLLIGAGLLLAYFGAQMLIIAEFGVLLFSLSTIFQLVTLPTEFNASYRALKHIRNTNILSDAEIKGAQKVLSAAALTYVAALAVSLLDLLRLIALVNRRKD